MAIAQKIPMVRGDTLPGITFVIADKNTPKDGMELDPRDPSTWRPVDLTNATVNAKIRKEGARAGEAPLDDISLTIVSAADGEVLLVIADANFKESAGLFEVEVTVSYPSGDQQTLYDWLAFDVRERF